MSPNYSHTRPKFAVFTYSQNLQARGAGRRFSKIAVLMSPLYSATPNTVNRMVSLCIFKKSVPTNRTTLVYSSNCYTFTYSCMSMYSLQDKRSCNNQTESGNFCQVIFQWLKGAHDVATDSHIPSIWILCPTRWNVRADSLASIPNNYEHSRELGKRE